MDGNEDTAATTSVSANATKESASNEEEAQSSCIICLDVISERGPHRAVTLRCGHIFGQDCIHKWVRERRKCPQCSKKSRPDDITVLYNLPKVGTVDTAVADELERKLAEVERQKRAAEQRLQRMQQDMQRMEQQLKRNRSSGSNARAPSAPSYQPGSHVVAHAAAAAAAAAQLAHLPVHLQGPTALMLLHGGQALPWLPGAVAGPAAAGASYYGPHQQQWQHQQQGSVPPVDLTGDTDDTVIILSASPPHGAAAAMANPQQQQRPGHQQAQQQQQHTRPPVPPPPPQQHAQPVQPHQLHSMQRIQQQQQPGPPQEAQQQQPQVPHRQVPEHQQQQLQAQQQQPSSHQQDHHPAAYPSSQLQHQQQHQHQHQQPLPPPTAGTFNLLQSYSTTNSRCFELHVPSALLFIPDTSPTSSSASSSSQASSPHLIRKYSILCPQTPQHMQLTGSVGMVRQVAYNAQQQFAAVATNGGLHLLSTVTNNYVARVDFQRPVWSCAWSRACQHQVICGLANGTLGVADLRMSGPASLLLVTQPAAAQPLHSAVALPSSSSGSSSSSAAAAADCIVATTSGVFSWRQAQPDVFAAVAQPPAGHSCESICWEDEEQLLGVSFRSALDGDGWGQHHILSSCSGSSTGGGGRGGDAAAAGQQQWLLRSKLWGHRSKAVMTKASFVRPAAGGAVMFASADEQLCQPLLWGLHDGGVWGRLQGMFQSPVLHMQGGVSSTLGGVLAAASKETLALYGWLAA